MGKKLQEEEAPKAYPTFTGLAQFGNIQVSTVTAQTEVYAAKLSSPSLVGMVAFFAGTVNPVGWLKCDGTAVSRSTYATLFNFIGTAYGAGDGGTTFNLPNLCDGSFIRGVGGNAAAIGAKQQDAVKAHTHGVPPIIAVAQDTPDASGYAKFANSQSGATSGQTPAGEVETRPLNTAMTPFIKY
jgi:microcystin-dependent protein